MRTHTKKVNRFNYDKSTRTTCIAVHIRRPYSCTTAVCTHEPSYESTNERRYESTKVQRAYCLACIFISELPYVRRTLSLSISRYLYYYSVHVLYKLTEAM